MLHTMEHQIAIHAYAIHVSQRLNGYFIAGDQRKMDVGPQLPAHLACNRQKLVRTLDRGRHEQDIFIALRRPLYFTNSM